MIKTIEQERASFCLDKVKGYLRDKSKLKTNGRRLPELVVSNGLIPTLAFYKAKDERKPIYDIVTEWLKGKKYINNDALDELTKANVSKLRLATTEALALANWLKRIVEVEIKEGD